MVEFQIHGCSQNLNFFFFSFWFALWNLRDSRKTHLPKTPIYLLILQKHKRKKLQRRRTFQINDGLQRDWKKVMNRRNSSPTQLIKWPPPISLEGIQQVGHVKLETNKALKSNTWIQQAPFLVFESVRTNLWEWTMCWWRWIWVYMFMWIWPCLWLWVYWFSGQCTSHNVNINTSYPFLGFDFSVLRSKFKYFHNFFQ